MTIPKDENGEMVEWPKPTPPGPGATIGERFEYSLAEGVRRFLSLFDEPLAEVGAWSIKLVLKVIEKSAGPYVRPLLDHYIETAPPGDPLKPMMEKLREAKGEAAAGALVSLASGAGSAGLLSILEPFFERARQVAYKSYPSKVFDPMTAIAAKWRGELSPGEFAEIMLAGGFDNPLHGKLETVARPRLPSDDLLRWFLRDRGRETTLRSELEARGMLPEDVDRSIELVDVIPGPTDQIRMAVREAFDPAIVRDYQLDADLHKVPFDTLEKVGLSEEWARYYWYAHWVLPSVMQGYEMLHRGEISEGELTTLMKSLDIMPGWIDHLIAISYRPYTRVDARRMYGMGVIDEDGVRGAYRDLGYHGDKLDNMVAFTMGFYVEDVKEETKTDILTAYYEGVLSREEGLSLLLDIGYKEPYAQSYIAATAYRIEQRERRDEEEDVEEELIKEREFTKADILSAYEDKVFSEEETRANLAAINYPATVINVLIAKVDYKVVQKLIREEIGTTKTLYVNQEIEVPAVHERLGKYALPATQIAELLTLWDIERARKTERPSVSQLFTFYYAGIITEERLREELDKHKYSPDYIEWFVANANQIILEREQKELERLEKEQERIDKSEFRTVRAVTLAELNVQIQEWKVYIADLKVAALYITEIPQLTEIKQNIVKAKAEIAGLQLAKAEVPVVLPPP